MPVKTYIFPAMLAGILLCGLPPAAQAERRFSLMEFDLNYDGVLSTPEVGERLFRMYDTDGNMVIDNNEYERKSVLTVVPVEREVTVSYDLGGDGLPDRRDTTYETFIYHTQLARFDTDRDGLSPREFVGTGFLKADINNDKAIDMNEWRASYDAYLAERLEDKARVNK